MSRIILPRERTVNEQSDLSSQLEMKNIQLLSSVLYCAHGNKEEQFSHLNSQESFGFSFRFNSRQESCVESIQASAKIEGREKERRGTGTSKKKDRAHLTSFSNGLRK